VQSLRQVEQVTYRIDHEIVRAGRLICVTGSQTPQPNNCDISISRDPDIVKTAMAASRLGSVACSDPCDVRSVPVLVLMAHRYRRARILNGVCNLTTRIFNTVTERCRRCRDRRLSDSCGGCFSTCGRQRLVPDSRNALRSVGPSKGVMPDIDPRVDDAYDHVLSVVTGETIARESPNLVDMHIRYAFIEL
jgi:hypothetical protein